MESVAVRPAGKKVRWQQWNPNGNSKPKNTDEFKHLLRRFKCKIATTPAAPQKQNEPELMLAHANFSAQHNLAMMQLMPQGDWAYEQAVTQHELAAQAMRQQALPLQFSHAAAVPLSPHAGEHIGEPSFSGVNWTEFLGDVGHDFGGYTHAKRHIENDEEEASNKRSREESTPELLGVIPMPDEVLGWLVA